MFDMSYFDTFDGKKIALYVWNKVNAPKAVVKIAHGMAEHSARYNHFAFFLNSCGYVVVMNDERGHGKSCDEKSYGYEEGDMFANNVQDQLDILKWCKKEWKLPVFMMGHSYGSFLTQSVMEQNPPEADGYILSGSNYIKGITYSACGFLAKRMAKKHGGAFPAKTIANMSFGMYEKKIPGLNNWLNRDGEEVKKYNEDPACGFVCSAGFYSSFMDGIKHLYDKEYYTKIDVEKPLLIISGSADPVGEYSKGVEKLFKFYTEKVGIKSIEKHLYVGARHEVLNEINKEEVYSDVVGWLQKQELKQ